MKLLPASLVAQSSGHGGHAQHGHHGHGGHEQSEHGAEHAHRGHGQDGQGEVHGKHGEGHNGHGHHTEAGDADAQHAHGHEHCHAEAGGIEWEDDMVDVNRITTPANMHWSFIDRQTGAADHAIDWRFRVGDQVKLRLVNEMDSDHPMHHPFHIDGAGRFVVLARDGVTEKNLVWKDTVLVRTGESVDILLDATTQASGWRTATSPSITRAERCSASTSRPREHRCSCTAGPFANTRWWPPFCLVVDLAVAAIISIEIVGVVHFHH